MQRIFLLCICCVLLSTLAPASAIPASREQRTYLPQISSGTTWVSPFGIQINDSIESSAFHIQHAQDLGLGWVRIGILSWKNLEPVEGGQLRWSTLAPLDTALRTLKAQGIRAQIIVADSPPWATVVPNGCAAIKPKKYAAFARVMAALAKRYASPEFATHDWELGNEIDVAPSQVGPGSGIGCWGVIEDPYYGGQAYGEMLKVVTPAIRAANPQARVWHGGLLLGRPDSPPSGGRPELFLEGVLAAGGGPYFDILAYHAYSFYIGDTAVTDGSGSPWTAFGGVAVGKTRFLRETLARYGFTKPLIMNEVAILCMDPAEQPGGCVEQNPAFLEVQANYLVRTYARLLAEGVDGIFWYKAEQPAWHNTSLIGFDNKPLPAYQTYRWMTRVLDQAAYTAPAQYGSNIEGYSFRSGQQIIDIVWSRDGQSTELVLPEGAAVYDRDGQPLVDATSAGRGTVADAPIYIVQQRALANIVQ